MRRITGLSFFVLLIGHYFQEIAYADSRNLPSQWPARVINFENFECDNIIGEYLNEPEVFVEKSDYAEQKNINYAIGFFPVFGMIPSLKVVESTKIFKISFTQENKNLQIAAFDDINRPPLFVNEKPIRCSQQTLVYEYVTSGSEAPGRSSFKLTMWKLSDGSLAVNVYRNSESGYIFKSKSEYSVWYKYPAYSTPHK